MVFLRNFNVAIWLSRLKTSSSQYTCLPMIRSVRFVWPSPTDGKVAVTAAQLAMLLEGIDWRLPLQTWRPLIAA